MTVDSNYFSDLCKAFRLLCKLFVVTREGPSEIFITPCCGDSNRNIGISQIDSVTEGCLSLTYSLKEIQEIYVTYLQTWLETLGLYGIANTYPDAGTLYLVCHPVRFIQKD